MIEPVPVRITVFALIGALIVMSVGSILTVPPETIGRSIVILFCACVVKVMLPTAVIPSTAFATPTVKGVLLCKVSV